MDFITFYIGCQFVYWYNRQVVYPVLTDKQAFLQSLEPSSSHPQSVLLDLYTVLQNYLLYLFDSPVYLKISLWHFFLFFILYLIYLFISTFWTYLVLITQPLYIYIYFFKLYCSFLFYNQTYFKLVEKFTD